MAGTSKNRKLEIRFYNWRYHYYLFPILNECKWYKDAAGIRALHTSSSVVLVGPRRPILLKFIVRMCHMITYFLKEGAEPYITNHYGVCTNVYSRA